VCDALSDVLEKPATRGDIGIISVKSVVPEPLVTMPAIYPLPSATTDSESPGTGKARLVVVREDCHPLEIPSIPGT
jgi:hypothetical protein